MGKISKEDLLKIKEDAIKVKERDIEDTIKSLDSQSLVSYYAVSVTLIFLVIIFRNIDRLSEYKTIFFLLLFFGFIILIIGSYNILSKKVDIHTKMSGVFSSDYKNNYSEHLDLRYKKLEEIYGNAKEGLLKKAYINSKLYILSGIFIFLVIILFNI